ncbi:MAG: ABC transporter permease [Clostridia bacterium]|nr:ABC transporter permease [Clostridia bacterium]
MKARSFRYLIGEGFKGAWANRLMSLASVGVLVACMVIIGLALLISQNISRALGKLEQQNVVMVYMKDYSWALYGDAVEKVPEGGDENGILPESYVIHNEEEAKALCDKIAELDNVESVEYISGEAGLESVKKNMIEGQEQYFSFLDEQYGNPLPAAAKVVMRDMSGFEKTVEQIKGIDGVDSIKAQNDLAERITSLKKGVLIAGIWIISILMIISLVVVSNTIRITMYSRKLEISIMKAVGATDAFVRIPFVVEGVLIGIISAGIAEGLLYFCYRVATETISQTLGTTDIVRYGEMVFYLLGVFLVIGIFAGAIGSFIMIGKYLRREGSEFSAI